MSDVELDYPYLMDSALRNVVRDVLQLTKELGAAPGEHHFYIEFLTQGAGVSIPDALIDTYPERMTIVLQHQFKDLEVENDKFSVTLWFKGEPSRLVIPFEALTTFADPSVQFELRFNAETALEGQKPELANKTTDSPPEVNESSASEENTKTDDESKSADVVSLDAFRKK